MKLLAIILGFLLVPAWAGRSFNGTTDKAQVASGSAVDLYGGSFLSMSCWFYVSSVPATEAQICGKGSLLNGTESYYFSLSQSGHTNTVGFHIWQSTPLNHNIDVFCSTTILANTWYNVVGTISSGAGGGTGNEIIYVNGSSCGSSGGANGTLSQPGGNNPDWCFGSYATTGSPGACTTANFAGIIAESALWNVALSAGEAQSLYHVCPKRVRFKSIVAYWPLYGASGTLIEPDQSGNLLNATLTGTAAANHPPCTP